MHTLLWIPMLTLPQVALACGGLFCAAGPGAAPVDQTAERIVFEVARDGRICTTAEIQYTGAPEAFAWVVPVPERPVVGEGDAALLDDLANRSRVRWQYPAGLACPEPGRGDSGCGDGSEVGLTSSDGRYIPFPHDAPVEVLDQHQTENYDTVTVAADAAADLVRWLEDNGFNVSPNMAPVMQPYADEGMAFLAIKLRTDRAARRIVPLRFCYAAEAPSIPLRLTAVAAQPQMAIQVFVLSWTLYAPIGAHGPPDPTALAFNDRGQVNYPAWVARQVAHTDGGFWALEYAGEAPRVSYLPAPEGTPCTDHACAATEACAVPDRVCRPRCDTDAECPRGSACTGLGTNRIRTDAPICLPVAAALEDDFPWLTTWYTRLGPEHMTHDPVFVPTPELPAYNGLIDLSARASIFECQTPIEARRPSACAFVYCGPGSTCVDFADGSAGCLCAGDEVAMAITAPGDLPQAVCAPAKNPLGITGEVGGDPCAFADCGTGECVNRNGFAACRCGDDVARNLDGRVTCEALPGEAQTFAEGAGPDAGNRDDAPARPPNRIPGVGAWVFGLLLAVGFLRRRRR